MSWTNVFKNVDLVKVGENFLTPEELEKSNLDIITTNITHPIRDIIGTEEVIVYHRDGKMERYFTYSIQPYENIDGIPLMNDYGQKMINDFLIRRKVEKDARYNNSNI